MHYYCCYYYYYYYWETIQYKKYNMIFRPPRTTKGAYPGSWASTKGRESNSGHSLKGPPITWATATTESGGCERRRKGCSRQTPSPLRTRAGRRTRRQRLHRVCVRKSYIANVITFHVVTVAASGICWPPESLCNQKQYPQLILDIKKRGHIIIELRWKAKLCPYNLLHTARSSTMKRICRRYGHWYLLISLTRVLTQT